MLRRSLPSLAAAITASAIIASADASSASAADAWYSINPSTDACYIPSRGPAEIIASAQQIARYRTHDTTDPNTGAIVETTIETASPLLGANDFVPLGTFYRGAARCEAEVAKEKAALAAQHAAAQAAQAAAVAKYGAQPSPDQIRAAAMGDPTRDSVPPENTLEKLRQELAENQMPKALTHGPGTLRNDTVALSADQRGAIGDHVRECWTKDAGALGADEMRVMLTVTTDPGGVVRKAVVAGSDVRRLGDPRFRAFAERVIRAIMDPRCASLPLPSNTLGQINVLTFQFSP